MFSFFKSSKKSPRESPEPIETDPIPNQPGSDDFLIVDRPDAYRSGGGSNISSSTGNLYPNVNQNTGIIGGIPTKVIEKQINYLDGIPFKLSSELTCGDTTEITRMQVDEILSFITRLLETNNTAASEYDMSQERSVITQ